MAHFASVFSLYLIVYSETNKVMLGLLYFACEFQLQLAFGYVPIALEFFAILFLIAELLKYFQEKKCNTYVFWCGKILIYYDSFDCPHQPHPCCFIIPIGKSCFFFYYVENYTFTRMHHWKCMCQIILSCFILNGMQKSFTCALAKCLIFFII